MTELVPPEDIERIVGVERHATDHYGRAVAAENRIYILHSQKCKDSGIDLRECKFSLAADEGAKADDWDDYWDDRWDQPVVLGIERRLVPWGTDD